MQKDFCNKICQERTFAARISASVVARTWAGRTFCFVTSFPTGNEQGGGMATVGNGAYSYEPVENWAKIPPGWSFKEIGGVGVDRNDNVFVFNRGEHPMIVFDREGKFLRSFGEGLFPRAHGVFMAPDDTVWLTDDGDHTVRQCTLEGKVLLTLGISGKPAPYMSGEPFHRCTHTAMSPQGDIYVSDGYGNSRVHKYAPNGKLLFSWGGPGTDPGEFNIAHNITCDADGWVYVADRENHRVQVFDGNGKYETQWNNLHRPCGLFMLPGKCPVCYIGELGAVQLSLSPRSVEAAARRMAERQAAAGVQVSGFLVQEMVPEGVEMIVGVVQDPVFGPVIACGAGGTAAELIKDVAVRLTPLTETEAGRMVRGLATFPLLNGYRGRPRVDVAALEAILVRVSGLAEDLPELVEVDLHPVMVTPSGAVVVDSRIRVELREPRPPEGARSRAGGRGPARESSR